MFIATEINRQTARRTPVLRLINTFYLLLVITLSAVGLSACGGDDPSQSTRLSASVDEGALRLTISLDKSTYNPFENINMQLTVQNISAEPLTLVFDRGTPPRFFNVNVNVIDRFESSINHFVNGDGREDMVNLQPGELRNYVLDWNQHSRPLRKQVDPGFYLVTSRLTVFPERIRFPNLVIEIK